MYRKILRNTTKKTEKLDQKLTPIKETLENLTSKYLPGSNDYIIAEFHILNKDLDQVIAYKNEILDLQNEGLRDYQYYYQSKFKDYLDELIDKDGNDSVLKKLKDLSTSSSMQIMHDKIAELASDKPYYDQLNLGCDLDQLVKKEGKLNEIFLLLRIVIHALDLIFRNCLLRGFLDDVNKSNIFSKDQIVYRNLLLKIQQASLEIYKLNLHDKMGAIVHSELYHCINDTYVELKSVPNDRSLIKPNAIFSRITSLPTTAQTSISTSARVLKNEGDLGEKSSKSVGLDDSQTFLPEEDIYQTTHALVKLISAGLKLRFDEFDQKSLPRMIISIEDFLYRSYFRSNKSEQQRNDLIEFYTQLFALKAGLDKKQKIIQISYECYADLLTEVVIKPNIDSFAASTKFINPFFSKMEKEESFYPDDRGHIIRIFTKMISVVGPISQQFDDRLKKHDQLRDDLFTITERVIQSITEHQLDIENAFPTILKFLYAHRDSLSEAKISVIKAYPEQFKEYFKGAVPNARKTHQETYLSLLKLMLALAPYDDLSIQKEIYEALIINNQDNKDSKASLATSLVIEEIKPDLIYFLTKAPIETLSMDHVLYFLTQIPSFEIDELRGLFFSLMQKDTHRVDERLVDFFKPHFLQMMTDVKWVNHIFQDTSADVFVKENMPKITIRRKLTSQTIDLYKEYLEFSTLIERRKKSWMNSIETDEAISENVKKVIDLLDSFFENFGENNEQLMEDLPSEQLKFFNSLATAMNQLIPNLVKLENEYPDLFRFYAKNISQDLNKKSLDIYRLLNVNNHIEQSIAISQSKQRKWDKKQECQTNLKQVKTLLRSKKYGEIDERICALQTALHEERTGVYGDPSKTSLVLLTPAEHHEFRVLQHELLVLKGDDFYHQFDMNRASEKYFEALRYPARNDKQFIQLKIKIVSCHFSIKSYFAAVCVIDEINKLPALTQKERRKLKLVKFKSLLALNSMVAAKKFLDDNFTDPDSAEYCLVHGLWANKHKNHEQGFIFLAQAFEKNPYHLYSLNLLISLYQEKYLNEIIQLAEKVLLPLKPSDIKNQLEIKILILKQAYSDALQKINLSNQQYPKNSHFLLFDSALCYDKLGEKEQALKCLKIIKFGENKSILALFMRLCYELNQPEALIQKIHEACQSCAFLTSKQYQECIEYCFKIGKQDEAEFVLNHAKIAVGLYPNQFNLSSIENCFKKNKNLNDIHQTRGADPVTPVIKHRYSQDDSMINRDIRMFKPYKLGENPGKLKEVGDLATQPNDRKYFHWGSVKKIITKTQPSAEVGVLDESKQPHPTIRK